MSLALTKAYNSAHQVKFHLKVLLKEYEKEKKKHAFEIFALKEYIGKVADLIILLKRLHTPDMEKQYAPVKDPLRTKYGRKRSG